MRDCKVNLISKLEQRAKEGSAWGMSPATVRQLADEVLKMLSVRGRNYSLVGVSDIADGERAVVDAAVRWVDLRAPVRRCEKDLRAAVEHLNTLRNAERAG